MKFDLSPALDSMRAMGDDFIARSPYIALALVVFFIFYALGKIVRAAMRALAERRRRHLSLGLVLGRLAQSAIVFVGTLVALVIALPSFKPEQLLQLLGISSVAIGFAFKDILQNFLAGILLLLNEPFRIGDQISVGSFEGTVEDIQTRATFIKTYDGRRVVIPNGDLFNETVVVNTAYAQRRLEYDFSVGGEHDIERAKALILGVLHRDEGVLSEPPPDVLTYELAGNVVSLRARWWIAPPRRADNLAVRDRVLGAVQKTLNENDLLPATQ